MILVAVLMIAASNSVTAQETKTVFGADSEIGFVWGIELKTAYIQQKVSTQYGMYAGALFNHAIMVGFTGAANVTHPSVNYGYTGLMVQYTYKPHNLVHLNGYVSLGSGSTKDYENEKTSVFDNFGNVTGEKFYFIEPGANCEINLGVKTRLVMGISYRFVNGIDPHNENISNTHVSDNDLSCVNINIGIKFGL